MKFMFDYLQKFKSLPKEIRDQVSGPSAIEAISELEEKYSIDLAAIVMKIMVGDILLDDLEMHFISEYEIDQNKAKSLVAELKQKIFPPVLNYLASLKKKKGGEERATKIVKAVERARVKGADFFFSPEDEEEIKILAQKVNGYGINSQTNGAVDSKLSVIISKLDINFGSELLINRFKSIIITYLRGIRDRFETKLALKKQIDDGGLGFDDESAERVLAVAESIEKQRHQDEIKLKSEAIKTQVGKKLGLGDIRARDVDYSFKNFQDDSISKKIDEKVKTTIDIEHELAPPPPIISKTSEEFNNASKKITATEIPVKKEDKILTDEKGVKKTLAEPKIKTKKEARDKDFKLIAKARKQIDTRGRKRMEDVKYVPKIMNPIDELHFMDLIIFRRLSIEPRQAASKIVEKINLLEDEHFSKRIAGVRAWRQSPVNRLYLQMGEQSINENKSIIDIIDERKSAGKDYLNEVEFSAIMDLNKSLRF